MRLALICSAGGASGFAAINISMRAGLLTASDILVVTDRACKAEETATSRRIENVRITNPDKEGLSQNLLDCLLENHIDLSVMLFSRMVSSTLFDNTPLLNIHPSLLPAFPGLGAINAAKQQNTKFLGATLHAVDENMDTGEIISQVSSPVDARAPKVDYDKISFIQKAYLLAVAIDLWANEKLSGGGEDGPFRISSDLRFTHSASPALQTSAMINEFTSFQNGEVPELIIP